MFLRVLNRLFPPRGRRSVRPVFNGMLHTCKISSNIHSEELYTGVLISPLPDQEGNKLGGMSGTRAISNKIETRAVIKFFFLQGKAPGEILAILTETLACFLPGWAKDLSAHLYNDRMSTSRRIGWNCSNHWGNYKCGGEFCRIISQLKDLVTSHIQP